LAPHDAYFEIVGVVSDFSNSGSLSAPILPEAFFPYTFASFGGRSLIVRTSNDPGFFADTIRRFLNEVDPNPILSHPSTLDVYLHEHDYLRPRFRLVSFGTCAAIGLTLALIGLFGVMSTPLRCKHRSSVYAWRWERTLATSSCWCFARDFC